MGLKRINRAYKETLNRFKKVKKLLRITNSNIPDRIDIYFHLSKIDINGEIIRKIYFSDKTPIIKINECIKGLESAKLYYTDELNANIINSGIGFEKHYLEYAEICYVLESYKDFKLFLLG